MVYIDSELSLESKPGQHVTDLYLPVLHVPSQDSVPNSL
jgi:hypothetical protein